MKNCKQTETQSVYEHGISVNEYFNDLKSFLNNQSTIKQWSFPDWLDKYKTELLGNLFPDDIIEKYTIFHDCGKPFCIEIDSEGKRHFPNHAQVSFETYSKYFPDQNPIIAELIRSDMDIHTISAVEIPQFCSNPQKAITLLLVGLSEVHSNAALFNGFGSTSFKIKLKQIDKRGKAICKLLFGDR